MMVVMAGAKVPRTVAKAAPTIVVVMMMAVVTMVSMTVATVPAAATMRGRGSADSDGHHCANE